ncbi:hypothetical protein V8F33_003442 [Rhypophila sp. PSN 637]
MSSPKPTSITDAARAAAPIPGSAIVGINVLYMVLVTVFTCLRMYTRFSVHKNLWWDDWTTVISWAGTLVFCSIGIQLKDHGGGLNFQDVPAAEFKMFNEMYQNVQMVARVSIFFAKLAILLLYIRIFYPRGTYKTALWWVIQAVIWLNLLYTVGLILTILLQCVPYHVPYGSPKCGSQYAILLSASTINIISDVLVLVIPMGSLWRLHMSRAKKLSICALFAFGGLAPLFSIARLVYQVAQGNGKNKTVIAETVFLLALAEQVVSIVTGCMPVVGVFFIKRVFNKKSTKGSGKPSNGPNRTITQRLWPNRESGKLEASDGWPSLPAKRKDPSNPYDLSTSRGDDTLVVSDEVLTANSAVEKRDIETAPGDGQSMPQPPSNAIHVVNCVSATSAVTRASRASSGHQVEVSALK